MHSPLSMQDAAHLRDASGPSPLRTMSSTPPMMSSELASAMPAGLSPGQTSTTLSDRGEALHTFAPPPPGTEHARAAPVEGRLESDIAIRLHIRPSGEC